MQASELVELAAVVAGDGPSLIEVAPRVSLAGLESYWSASKSRLDRWGRSLKQLRQVADEGPELPIALVAPLAEEVLASDMLSRIWTAVLCGYDRRRGEEVAGPVAQSVYLAQSDTLRRTLELLLRSPAPNRLAAGLDTLRRRLECWTDMLIGFLSGAHPGWEFAYNPDRAREFAADLRYRARLPGGRHVWPLVRGSMRAACAGQFRMASPNADMNARVAASILCMFPGEAFDSTGLPRSVFLARLEHAAQDAEAMIDTLFAEEGLPARRRFHAR